MRIKIVAIGRLKSRPERAIFDDYRSRFDKLGKGLGLGPLEVTELDDRKVSQKTCEADLILRGLSNVLYPIALDQRGDQLDSPKFSKLLAKSRDAGHTNLTFVIGGADGLHHSVMGRCQKSISLGKMVWPHMLARVMLSEQLYRAATILAGTRYHRA